MNISVIICTLNNHLQLEDLISNISSQSLIPLETIIVHGERDIETKIIVEKWKNKGLNIKYLTAPRSLVLQRNVGIKATKGDIISFLDDDVVLEKDYFKNLIRAYLLDNTIGGVQGTITNNKKPSLLKYLFYELFFLDNTFGNGKLKKSGLPSFHKPHPSTVKVEVFNGCLMSFRSSIIKQNLFDEFYKNNWWGDDYETSYNISVKHNLIQIPNSKLFHYGNASFNKSKKLAYMRGMNLSYIRKKHGLCKGINKLICLWSDIGQFLLYVILFIKGEGLGYLNFWIKGILGKDFTK